MPALTTEQVLRDEAKAIHGKDIQLDPAETTEPKFYRELSKLNSAALCLSGGGIRSAAFALGVLQALAAHPRSTARAPVPSPDQSLLAKFQYLSTVSGGGYIGSWLSAWISRVGFASAWQDLVRRRNPNEEPVVLSWLRNHSNYLTPKIGLLSADTWTGVSLYLRNLFLNWLVLLPVLCLLLLLLKSFAIIVAWFSRFSPIGCDNSFYVLPSIGVAALGAALLFTVRNRPTRGDSPANERTFILACLSPALASGFAFICTFASPCG